MPADPAEAAAHRGHPRVPDHVRRRVRRRRGYTPVAMDATLRGEHRDRRTGSTSCTPRRPGRSAYAGNTLRAVRDRYRAAYLDDLSRWNELSDDLGGAGARRRAGGSAPRRRRNPEPTEPRRRRRPGPRTSVCARAGRGQPGDAAASGGTRASCRAWSSPSATSSTPGCSSSARTRRSSPTPSLPVSPTELQMRILEAQEAERSRLAQEVHDGPAQALSNAIFQVEFIDRVFESDPRHGPDRAALPARAAAARARRRARLHHPAPAAGARRARPVRRDRRHGRSTQGALSGLASRPSSAAPADGLDEPQQTVVLRVVQEALQNVRKHAGATNVVVATRLDGWTNGCSRSATTVAASIPARSRREAVATSACSSCASGRSWSAPSSRFVRGRRRARVVRLAIPMTRARRADDASTGARTPPGRPGSAQPDRRAGADPHRRRPRPVPRRHPQHPRARARLRDRRRGRRRPDGDRRGARDQPRRDPHGPLAAAPGGIETTQRIKRELPARRSSSCRPKRTRTRCSRPSRPARRRSSSRTSARTTWSPSSAASSPAST